MVRSGAVQPAQYLLLDLAIATNNFSDENKIGSGGSGVVYKVIYIHLSLICLSTQFRQLGSCLLACFSVYACIIMYWYRSNRRAMSFCKHCQFELSNFR